MDMYPKNIENAYNIKKQANIKYGQKSWAAILQKKIWMYDRDEMPLDVHQSS